MRTSIHYEDHRFPPRQDINADIEIIFYLYTFFSLLLLF